MIGSAILVYTRYIVRFSIYSLSYWGGETGSDMTYFHFYLYAFFGHKTCMRILITKIASNICNIDVVSRSRKLPDTSQKTKIVSHKYLRSNFGRFRWCITNLFRPHFRLASWYYILLNKNPFLFCSNLFKIWNQNRPLKWKVLLPNVYQLRSLWKRSSFTFLNVKFFSPDCSKVAVESDREKIISQNVKNLGFFGKRGIS